MRISESKFYCIREKEFYKLAFALRIEVYKGMKSKVTATATQTGYPAGLRDGNLPKSTIPSKDVAKVPWAAENLLVPESGQSGVSYRRNMRKKQLLIILNVLESKYVHCSTNQLGDTK
jgi:hypothetical protein